MGVQVLLLGTLIGQFLAPILWSFWLVAAGLGHPLTEAIPPLFFALWFGLFLISEGLNISLGVLAARATGKRHLQVWALLLPLYFPIATIAAYKALFELITRPFHWDKTEHGVLMPESGRYSAASTA